MQQLVDALVDRDTRAERKQQDRDDKAPKIQLGGVAKRVSGVGRALDRLIPISSNPWLDVSTSEWIASDSMADDPLHPAAANLATAMPRLQASATATTAVDPLADTCWRSLGWANQLFNPDLPNKS